MVKQDTDQSSAIELANRRTFLSLRRVLAVVISEGLCSNGVVFVFYSE